MHSLYLLSDKNLAKVEQKLALKFKNVAKFDVKIDKNEFLKCQKSVMKNLINKFELLSQKSDFIVVVGCKSEMLMGDCELNLQIAKHLNCPVYDEENLNELKLLNQNSKLIITDDLDEILKCEQDIITPIKFENILINRAKELKKTVVLPESEDDRILQAAAAILADDIASIILLGDENLVQKRAKELGVSLDKAKIIDIQKSELKDKFAHEIYELRKAKGLSEDEAKNLATQRNYFATMLVKNALADAVVSGAVGTTADTIRPALQLIKTKEGTSSVSGLFFMSMAEEILLYADCAITPNPDPQTLATIAISTAKSAEAFGITPKIAMLSYSTANSGKGESVDATKEATKLTSQLDPSLAIAGPIQYDAAVDIKVAAKKMPDSAVAGHANVFIFPDLNSANICYKAVQRNANAVAIGPVLQGLKKPVNDLSRGALTQDIINTILISAIQAGE
ncbi:MAG: phosphate acetyltransferase [Campylobacter sp.]|nr:phosphate acetyltransferase [Campylobacter sp.]